MRNNRTTDIIEHILLYCNQINEAHAMFGTDSEAFQSMSVYFNSVTMCILQIGELVRHLDDLFIAEYGEIPWRQIRGMRNIVAHEYGTLDLNIVWDVSTNGIHELKQFCEKYLEG